MENIAMIESINMVKFSLFAPIERETPIVEVLFKDKIILDFSFIEDSTNNDVEILFHNDISRCKLKSNLIIEIIEKGIERLKEGTFA
jgi:hypothetical protein